MSLLEMFKEKIKEDFPEYFEGKRLTMVEGFIKPMMRKTDANFININLWKTIDQIRHTPYYEYNEENGINNYVMMTDPDKENLLIVILGTTNLNDIRTSPTPLNFPALKIPKEECKTTLSSFQYFFKYNIKRRTYTYYEL